MEISEAFDLIEKEVADIGMVDAYGNTQDVAWAFAIYEKSMQPDAGTLREGLCQGIVTAREYYENSLPLLGLFRVQYLAARSKKRMRNRLAGLPAYQSIDLDVAFDPATFGWETWWDDFWIAVEHWAKKQPEPACAVRN